MIHIFYYFIYNTLILIYVILIRLATLFHAKAKRWVDGRKNWRQNLMSIVAGAKTNQQPIVWVHCASLGEFEQARPVIEAIKVQYPQYFILLSFFSPSGYEIRKHYTQVDAVVYLPADIKSNAKDFIQLLHPCLYMAIFIKYELWLNYLLILKQHNIPHYLISAIFHPQFFYFKWYGSIFKKQLESFTQIFVQNKSSLAVLKKQLASKNYCIAPDTRFDRVWQNKQQAKHLPIIESFKQGRRLVICGSTWPKDEALLIPCVYDKVQEDNLGWIIAPHEISEPHLHQIEKQLAGIPRVRYSQVIKHESSAGALAKYKVLIIDNIGMLSSIYKYGYIAYVGGGFGVGIHNILEAAVFGLPIIIGPNYQYFQEAKDLVAEGAAFSIQNKQGLAKQLHKLLTKPLHHKNTAHIASHYVANNVGGTQLIMDFVFT